MADEKHIPGYNLGNSKYILYLIWAVFSLWYLTIIIVTPVGNTLRFDQSIYLAASGICVIIMNIIWCGSNDNLF